MTLDQLDDIIFAIQSVYPMAYPLDSDGDNMALLMRDTLAYDEEMPYTLSDLLETYANVIDNLERSSDDSQD